MTTTAAAVTEQRSVSSILDRVAPSIPAIFFVSLSLFASLVAQRQMINGDGDLARHLRHGLYMLEHHTLIWRDPFSFTRPGYPFVPFEYGSQLIYALVYKAAGLAGVTVFAGCLIGATYALMARVLLRRHVEPLLVIVATGAAVLLGFPHWVARPHLVSWIAIVVCFSLLESAKRPPIWTFPLLFAVWANVHGGWLYGIALLAIYLIGHLVEYRFFDRSGGLAAARYFAVALALSIVATLATPMGLRLWEYLYRLFGDTYIFDHTREFRSPDFHSFFAKILLAIMLGALAALIASRRRIYVWRWLVVMCGVWWALTAVRNLPLFGLTGLSIVALHLDPEWRSLSWGWLNRRRAAFAAGADRASTTAWVALCTGFLGAVAIGHGEIFGKELLPTSFDPKAFPVTAVAKARGQHLTGRLFADFTWGGYILFAWPEQRVFIDGGTDFYGGDIMSDYEDVSGLSPGWREKLERWRVDLVLTRSNSKLARELVRTPGWVVWYCDSVSLLAKRGSVELSPTAAANEAQLQNCVGSGLARD